MTFDDIKEMQIGSKKVKEAWLNGRQVYPSEKRITDSLVCWYDPGKQQCTNESMAANPVLRDLSGNGHDIECFNFGWAGMSGIGGYKWNFNNFLRNLYPHTDSTIRLDFNNVPDGHDKDKFEHLIDNNNGKLDNTILEGVKIRVSGVVDSAITFYMQVNFNSDTYPNYRKQIIIEKDGEYELPDIDLSQFSNDTIVNVYYGFTFVDGLNTSDIVDIEQLPLYPNALVSDGVDDYCYTEGLPILTDYTVIAKRKWIGYTGNCALASKFKNDGLLTGAFGLEYIGTDKLKEYWNFGTMNAPVLFPEEITYGTPTLYNGVPVKRGSASDNEVLSLFSMRENNQTSGQIALYSFLLFDRTLTTEEIEWVKKNMIESGGGVENGLE